MSKHVIVGSGPVGSSVARLLAERGESVRVVTRSGTGPAHPLIERIAADATDADRLTELTRDAVALYNCANPKYTQWESLWPPLAGAMLTAAQRTGAVLAITGNLYVYGPVPGGRMTEDSPLAATGRKGRVRIKMWQDALASGVRTVEVRGSDYIGAGAASLFSQVLLPAIAKGRTAWMPGDVDAPHTFTYTGDMARALVALAADDRAFGRAWHVPSVPALSVRALADGHQARRDPAAAALRDADRGHGGADGPRAGRDGLPVLRAVHHGQLADRAHVRPHRHRPGRVAGRGRGPLGVHPGPHDVTPVRAAARRRRGGGRRPHRRHPPP
jgi:nucleoside-diphosphate-sugar epimerase